MNISKRGMTSKVEDVDTSTIREGLEFCNVCAEIANNHKENNTLDYGECHIAIDKLPDVKREECADIAVLVCANISTLDKFMIVNSLIEALDFSDNDLARYLITNLEELSSK